MEVRIGVKHVTREITVETDATADEVLAAVRGAIETGELFTIIDSKGGTSVVPADSLAYVHIGEETGRKVGFGI